MPEQPETATTASVNDVEQWSDWIGATQVRDAVLTDEQSDALIATLGRSPGRTVEPPPGVHWLIFERFVDRASVGSDGHERRGTFLPPVELPRRMWAGGAIELLAPLRVGVPLRRTSRIRSVTSKSGHAGPLVFVTVDHEIADANTLFIRERQDLVYTNITAPRTQKPAAETASPTATVVPDAVMLFGYSALTRNSHRIHYDADFARDVECYPNLVVHGPLIATLLMWQAQATAPDRRLSGFEFRARAPSYVGEPLALTAHPGDGRVELTAGTADGGVGMTATARLD